MQNKFIQYDGLVSSSLKYRSLSSINVNWLSCLSITAQVHSNSVVCKYICIYFVTIVVITHIKISKEF